MTQPTQPPSAPTAPPPSDAPPTDATAEPSGATPVPGAPELLRRSPRQKLVAGVCGGLGRYCDVDPVIFRIVLGVLAAMGGLGLVFYGFAWLLIPLEGEEENEGRRLLSGRVDGASLIAVLLALAGCGLFLSMLDNGEVLAFAGMLSVAVAGSAVWSQRRRGALPDGAPLDPASAHLVAEAPPETQAPPPPGTPSWWRDPLTKDGPVGPVGPMGPVGADYMWGPESVRVEARAGEWHRGAERADEKAPDARRRPECARREAHGISGLVFVMALAAGALAAGPSWADRPLGTSLEIGLAAALGVFGLGLVVSSFLGRTGAGTVFLAVVTAGLLAGSAALPKNITSEWSDRRWTPASVASVRPHYEVGTGTGTLDLSGVSVAKGETVSSSAEVGAGRLKVVVPKGVRVEVTAKAGLGDIQFPGEPPNDVEVSPHQSRGLTLEPSAGSAPAGTLRLTLEVTLGQVVVDRAAA
ncbi:PspC domain-containing protein [Streptomyces sp. NPDC093085]|uniref:PspC domain-containing protein n=1 Tax=Streptomyces sp. NPDC093085 TaxID=3155068 RepID=UPI00341E55F0